MSKPKNKTQYFLLPDLRDQAHTLYHRSGVFKKAGEKILALISLISNGDNSPLAGMKLTKKGESRLDKCIKYDLPGACRLVTVQDKGKVIFVFAGDHAEEEKWLEANRGKRFAVDHNSRIDEVRVVSATLSPGDKPTITPAYSKGKLYELLKDEEYDYLVSDLARSISRLLESLHSFSSDDDLFDAVDKIPEEDQKNLVLDVFVSLKEGDIEEANRRIALEKGEYSAITETSVQPSERIYEIRDDDPAFAELFKHFIKTADYKKWMLFMHPSQQEIVDIDFKGSAKLLGVSGSGKTCVVVKRAVRLASTGESVLIVTLNRSLAKLIEELVESISSETVHSRVHVRPFFKVCQQYLHKFEPNGEKLFDDTTWKSKEHIDEIWTEFYRCELNNEEAKILHTVHDSLIAQSIDAESYIREEFDWIRSAIPHNDRNQYLTIERDGRSIQMPKQYRQLLLEGLDAWERKMRAIGVTDYLGLASALARHNNKIVPQYDHVIVDESQDFGTMEMALIRKITKEGKNDVFVAGDAAQRVSSKYQSLKSAKITISSTSTKKLLKNYRNSREILSAAHSVLNSNSYTDHFKAEDFEVLDPEYSSFSDSSPLCLETNSLEDEISYALSYAKGEIEEHPNYKICIALCGYSLYEIEVFGKDEELTVLTSNTSMSSDSLFLSDLEQTKGFEFDVMIVVNVNQNVIPNSNLPEKENYRELSHLYVAMTRAKSELILSHSGKPSQFLDSANEDLIFENWSEYYISELEKPGLPKRLSKIRNEDDSETIIKPIALLSGPEFLYLPAAIGIDTFLSRKLRDLITGESVKRNSSFVRWRNIGTAYHSGKTDAKCRAVFGSEGWPAFEKLAEDLNLPAMVEEIGSEKIYFIQ